MSGIAGILRRDGREIPDRWVQLLEQSLQLHGGTTWRYEDSNIILIGSGTQVTDTSVSDPIVVDGDLNGECAFARWNVERGELELGREGSGQKSLYWLDLDAAGDGLVFCSNPIPLLKITRELELPNEYFSQGVYEYLQRGFVNEGAALLSPLYAMPIHHKQVDDSHGVHILNCDIPTTPAEDVLTLVKLLGVPFGDSNVLSTLWQYRYAKQQGYVVKDGVCVRESPVKPTQFLKRISPNRIDESLVSQQRVSAMRTERGLIASHVGITLGISDSLHPITPIAFPLTAWIRSPQSSIGQLVGDTFNSQDAFRDLPIAQNECIGLLETHRSEKSDCTEEIFKILTLVLWNQQVHA